MRGDAGVAVAIAHRLPEHLADLQRLRHQHRRLVGAADAREIDVGIEAGGRRLLEAREKRRPIAAPTDVVADDRGFVAVEDDQIAAARILQRLRRGRAGLLVPVSCRG